MADELDRGTFERSLSETTGPIPPWMTQFDSQVGFAVRKYCAPLLGLREHADADSYWQARCDFPTKDLSQRLLQASGVSHSLVDTGVIQSSEQSPTLYSLAEFQVISGQHTREVVRLESLLERLVNQGVGPEHLEREFDEALREATRTAVGFKSIIAYRYGFDFVPERPSSADCQRAAEAWYRQLRSSPEPPRVKDPVLLRMLLWKATETGLPVQLHAGYGDPDLDLHRCNPLLLTSWIRSLPEDASDIVLLHCYPFHREAGYLAQVFPRVFFDVGLAINFSGAMSDRIIAESLELAPFSKVLYSSDAWGLPELHYIGAALWRRGMARVLSGLVADGDWSVEDAIRIVGMTGKFNALRLYRMDDAPSGGGGH